MTELTLGEFSNILSYLIDNNKTLVDKGDTPIAVCLEGEAGLGKTAVVQQLAETKGMTFVKVNLAQIEEPAELIGFPYKEYEIIKPESEEAVWVSADLLRDMSCDYKTTGKSRMSYAVPSWVPSTENDNGTMLVLDDFSRANSLIMQAVMELINTGSYLSWKLPKYTNIVLTSNPDNSNYSVTGLDMAQKSRFICFSGKFDIKEWASWAETFDIDSRAINFAMLYETELFKPRNGVVVANARNYTTFCRAISGISDWSEDSAMTTILQISSGCFLHKDNPVGVMFTQFIANKLDKLISPEEMLNGAWDTVSKKMENSVYENSVYKASIASILGTRLLNYCDKCISTKRSEAKKVAARLEEIANSEKQLLTQDILYNIIKSLSKKHVAATNTWFLNKTLRNIAL